jgi:uncharacterized repeat protein (TIGR01451 family)
MKSKSLGTKWRLVLGALLVLALSVGSVPQAFANLPGSTFEGNDGNLTVNTAGNTDWVNAPNRVRGDDLPSGTNDNSFGQGTKEDSPSVTVVTGSIPPNKSDLTRFYVANEQVASSGNIFLYLAWERANVLGSANMDFEINQKPQPDLTSTGPKTLIRTAGDLLVTFDFTNGGGNPVLGLLTWVTSGPTTQCFSSNTLPCWGNRVDLSAAGFAEGQVNASTITDPIAGVSLAGLEFGEAALNLTAAGVFPSGVCEAFGSTFLKSRSSNSFTAEVKDFVAPQPVNITNCPRLGLTKTADAPIVNAGDQIGFSVTVSNSGQGPAQNVAISDALPSGSGVNWSLSPSVAGCSITGSPQMLNCSFASLASGASQTVHVISGTSFASCATYNNTAQAQATSSPPVTASASTTVQCPALTITKTADAASVSAGTNIGFTVTVSNSSAAGTGTAKSVTLSDALPTGSGISWSIVQATPTCAISGSPQTLSCTFGDLAPGASATVHVTSPTTSASCATYPNTASAQATNHPQVQASASTTVLCPSINIAKTSDASPVGAGDTIGFLITVSNGGPGQATGVAVSDTLPATAGLSWSIDAANSDAGCSIGAGTLTCNFGSLDSGASKHVHITSPTTFASCATIPNSASVTTTNDGSGSSSASVVVQCPSLAIVKAADVASVNAGDVIRFTITVSNGGPGIARGVTVNDPLPAGSGIVWSIDPVYGGQGTCSITGTAPSQVLGCSIGDMASGSSDTIHLSSPTTGQSAGTYPNTVTATATNDGTVTSQASLIVHAFRIVTLVCRQNADNSGYLLFSSTVTDGDTGASATTPATVAGLTDAQVCGLNAHFDNKGVGTHGESVNIPDNP